MAMCRFAAIVWALSLGPLVMAQAKGNISGTVTGPDGAVVKDAPVQAKNTATGTPFRARSSTVGKYTLSQLPEGKYVVSVTMPGFSFEPFVQPDVALKAGQTLLFDIRLAEGPSLGTLGDDPGLQTALIRAKIPPPSGRTPRMPNGKPDFSGVWNGNDDPYPEDPDLLPAAGALVKERTENNFRDAPTARCLPAFPIPLGVGVWKLVQTPSLLVTIIEDIIGARQVYLDGRPHPKRLNPSWYGHSIGKWEGDTLVIDSAGFNDKSWILIFPHTEKLHVTERYRRPDLGHLEIDATLEDPDTFAKPWKAHNTWELAPGEDVLEYVCSENNTNAPHLVGK